MSETVFIKPGSWPERFRAGVAVWNLVPLWNSPRVIGLSLSELVGWNPLT